VNEEERPFAITSDLNPWPQARSDLHSVAQ
jgi:hypothetical protein